MEPVYVAGVWGGGGGGGTTIEPVLIEYLLLCNCE